MSTYILLKDTPELPAGQILEWNEVIQAYSTKLLSSDKIISYKKELVENKPKWFRKEEVYIPPPIGIFPEWLWREHRLHELHQAVKRYREANEPIPSEWELEIGNHVSWLQINLPSKKIKKEEKYSTIINDVFPSLKMIFKECPTDSNIWYYISGILENIIKNRKENEVYKK